MNEIWGSVYNNWRQVMRLRSLFVMGFVLCFASAAVGDAEVITEKMSAEDLARAFEKDAKVARKT